MVANSLLILGIAEHAFDPAELGSIPSHRPLQAFQNSFCTFLEKEKLPEIIYRLKSNLFRDFLSSFNFQIRKKFGQVNISVQMDVNSCYFSANIIIMAKLIQGR